MLQGHFSYSLETKLGFHWTLKEIILSVLQLLCPMQSSCPMFPLLPPFSVTFQHDKNGWGSYYAWQGATFFPTFTQQVIKMMWR